MTKSRKYLVDGRWKQPFNWSEVRKFNSFSGISSSSVDKIEYEDDIDQINCYKIDKINSDEIDKIWNHKILNMSVAESYSDIEF